jgi:hypothetical protein
MTEPLDLEALAASSRPASPPMTASERHAAAIFEVLHDGEKVLVHDILELSGLTYRQFQAGWTHIKRSLGTLAVCEPHGRNTTYCLVNEVTVASHEYRYWQGKHAYSRLWSVRATLAQMIDTARRAGDTDDAESLRIADMGVVDALAHMKGELRRAGSRAEASTDSVEKYLADIAATFAS